ncbi:MAG: alkaline phosphatase PhoX [Rhizobiaceae bacterium]
MKRSSLASLTLALTICAMPSAYPLAAEVALTRIATMPDGAEVTGVSINGLGDLFLNAQHPGGKDMLRDDAPPAIVGYIEGFDSSKISSPGMEVPPEGSRSGVSVAMGEYVALVKAGETLGSGQVFGGVYDAAGALMYVSNTPDFNGFIPVGANTAYLYTAWEGAGRDGASAVSKVLLNRVDGKWQADLSASRMLDLSSVDGGFVLCSGIVTPWGTPILSEEYFYYNTAVWNHPDNHDEDERASFQKGNDITYIKPKNMAKYLGRMANPYRYGYLIEINGAASSSGEELVKRYATGRLSHETAAVMPDMRTLYMSDDDSAIYSDKKYNTASGGVFFKFVADRKGDLSSGTLYAAKLVQDKEDDPHKAGFDVSWIELGHASEEEIAGWISTYDNVQVSDYKDGATNYISDDEIRAHASGTAKDARAAFLESRRTAAAMGATNEWDKLEGVTASGNTVYIAASGIAFTMDKSWGLKDWSTGEIDTSKGGDIALNAEKCGGTYKAVTGADYSITRIEPHVIGKITSEGRCEEGRPANPDNILALSDGSLLIGEDAGPKAHSADMLWLAK